MVINSDLLFDQIYHHLSNLHMSRHFIIPFIFLCHLSYRHLIHMIIFVLISISIQFVLATIFDRFIKPTASIDHSIISSLVSFNSLFTNYFFPLNQSIHIPVIIIINNPSSSVLINYQFPMWTSPLQIFLFSYKFKWVFPSYTKFITSTFKELSTLFDLQSPVIFIYYNPHH